MKLIDRTGVRYGHTIVQSRAPNKSKSDTNARWWCLCDCGNMHVAYGNDLGKGQSSNCGCLRKFPKGINKTHGMSRTRVYRIWCGMKSRCGNKADPKYYRYGGRGIKVCERWEKFENFLEDMGDPEDHLSLDRKDNDKGYNPDNCQWATDLMQSLNRRSSRKLTYNDVTLSVSQWAKILGITSTTMYGRIDANFPPEKLFSKNLKHKDYRLKYGDNLVIK